MRALSRRRHICLLLATTGTAVVLASATFAQEPVASVAGRPGGGSGASPTGSGLASPGLRLPDSLVGNDPPAPPTARPSAAVAPTSGAGRRAGLRDNRARRSRQATVQPVQGPFRSTITPQTVAPNVQPVQTGVPDPTVPTLPGPGLTPVPSVLGPPLRRRPPTDTGTVAIVPNTQPGLLDPALPVTVRPAQAPNDPYAQLGIRLGGLTLLPAFGQSIGYDSNPNRTDGNRRGSFLSQTEGELGIQSNWSRHELTGFLRGAYDVYPSNPAANRPEGAGRLGLRIDATRDTQFDVEGHYQIDTQRPGNPNLGVATRERPDVFTEGASAGVTQRFNRLVVGLRGTVDRADYDDAKLTDGTTLSQRDRDLTSYGGRLRVGYELTPGLVPFVEGTIDTRQYDLTTDSAGFRRSSDGYAGRLGTTFELTRLLTGEISAGAVHRVYQDSRLPDLTSPVADLSLIYAFSPLTTIRATGTAAVDETTVPGANGIRTFRGGVEIAHQLRRNLTLTAGFNLAEYDYLGATLTEREFAATVRADYRVNRWLALRASYSYDHLHSTLAGSSYAANVFLLGMRFTP